MVKGYKPHSKEWWNERRIELYRLFSSGHNTVYIKGLLDGNDKRLFPNNLELTKVKAAFNNHDDPFADSTPPADAGGTDDTQRNIPPLRGPSFIGTVRPRMVTLDPRLFILYDLTKEVFPEYEKDEGQWIHEAILAFYSEHSEEFELGRLFTQPKEGTDDNREAERVAGTTEVKGEDES